MHSLNFWFWIWRCRVIVCTCKTNILQVEVDGNYFKIYGACIGGKGDWPYVRKCYGLKTGFNVPTRMSYVFENSNLVFQHAFGRIWLTPQLEKKSSNVLINFLFLYPWFFLQLRHGGLWEKAILFVNGKNVRGPVHSNWMRVAPWEPFRGLTNRPAYGQTKCMCLPMAMARTLLQVQWCCVLGLKSGQEEAYRPGLSMLSKILGVGANVTKNLQAWRPLTTGFSKQVRTSTELDIYNKGVPPCWDSLYTYGKSSKPVAPTNNTTLASKGLQWMANWLWQSLWCNLDFQMDWGGIDWWLWHSSLHQIWIYKGYKLLVWDTPSSKYFLEFHFHFFLCIHPCHKALENTDLFEVIRWTLKHTSVFFRALHKSGIWLSLDLARKAAASGWSMTDSSI